MLIDSRISFHDAGLVRLFRVVSEHEICARMNKTLINKVAYKISIFIFYVKYLFYKYHLIFY